MDSLPTAVIEEFALGSHIFRDAFRKLFRMYYPKVRVFIQGFVKNKEDANDLAQMVFIRLWEKRDKFSDVHNFDAYLFMITKHNIGSFMAKQHALLQTDDGWLPEMTFERTPHDELVQKDLQLYIQLVVEHMPAKRREIYRMSREQDLSNEEIAERLGIQKKTVENHLNLALRMLKEALAYRCLVLSLPLFWV